MKRITDRIAMSDKIISDEALDIVFRNARTRNGFEPRPVSRALIQAVYDLLKMGPTSANCSPARFVFVVSPEGKKRLEPHLSEGNRAKTMAAPCCVIIGQDLEFYEKLPRLFPHTNAKSWFEGNEDLITRTAFRNATLQGAYLIIAARALGLDCGPMSGFDNAGVDREFFAGTPIRSNFLCNLGYGTDENLFPRSPRLDFDEACSIA
jgi:3-hydroxypropanoate dehydrogenase